MVHVLDSIPLLCFTRLVSPDDYNTVSLRHQMTILFHSVTR